MIFLYVIVALGVIVGFYTLFTWLFRKTGGGGGGTNPTPSLQSVGVKTGDPMDDY
jgi:hypothetical protein